MSDVEAAHYSRLEKTRDSRPVEIRSLHPNDRLELMAAIGRSSARSLYRRFFRVKRHFTDEEVDPFLNIDFKTHVALVAIVEDKGRPTIAGGGRYVVVNPDSAELAFMVVDDFQGQSIGALLMKHLALLARQAGLSKLIADVLSHNMPMLRVFEKSGLPVSLRREGPVTHVTLGLSERQPASTARAV